MELDEKTLIRAISHLSALGWSNLKGRLFYSDNDMMTTYDHMSLSKREQIFHYIHKSVADGFQCQKVAIFL